MFYVKLYYNINDEEISVFSFETFKMAYIFAAENNISRFKDEIGNVFYINL